MYERVPPWCQQHKLYDQCEPSRSDLANACAHGNARNPSRVSFVVTGSPHWSIFVFHFVSLLDDTGTVLCGIPPSGLVEDALVVAAAVAVAGAVVDAVVDAVAGVGAMDCVVGAGATLCVIVGAGA